MISEESETNEASFMTGLAHCLEALSRQQHLEREPKQSLSPAELET